jgi:glycosyltransferase involved in cell wall biosynthesis
MTDAQDNTNICVVHVFPFCHKVSGGHNNAIRAFIKCESERGVDSRMICPGCDPQPLEETITEERVLTRKLTPPSAPEQVELLPVLARSKNLLFHFHGLDHGSTRCARILLRLSIPYVFTSHGTLYCRDPIHFLKKFAYLNFVNRFVRHADGFHFHTMRMALQFPNVLPFSSREVVVAANVVASPESEQVVAAERGQFGIPQDAFLFLYMGRLDAHTKGLDLLVKAFARFPAKSGMWLALVGPDWKNGLGELGQLATRLKCADRVSFLGPQYGDDKWKVLKMADAFISPSRWDAFPISLVEAMGFGLPVVTSTAVNIGPDLRRVRGALLSDLSPESIAAAMKELSNRPELRKDLAARGRTWVTQNCSPQIVGERLAELYQGVLRGRYG